MTGVNNLQEMARLAREELLSWIQPVQLLSLNPDRQTGEVSGRFRSSGMLFDYSIKDGTVSYKPVGAKGRSDAAEHGVLGDRRLDAKRIKNAEGQLDLLGDGKGIKCGDGWIRPDYDCSKGKGPASGAAARAKTDKPRVAADPKSIDQEIRRLQKLQADHEEHANRSGHHPGVIAREVIAGLQAFNGGSDYGRRKPGEGLSWSIHGQNHQIPESKLQGLSARQLSALIYTKINGGKPSPGQPFGDWFAEPQTSGPVGSGRKDAVDSTVDLVRVLRASQVALQKGWSASRADSYLDTQDRLDAGKNCGKGFGCGSTCIDRSKQCRVTGGKAAQRLGSMVRGGGAGAPGGNTYKGYDLTPPSNPSYAGSNAEVAKVTKALRDRIGQQEPAATRMMVDLADGLGAQLDGLSHRMKAEQSLGRKIENEYENPPFNGDLKKCAESMSDVVRYTMKTTNENYTDMAEATIKKFESEGWNARVKNYWEAGQPYRGMNVALTSPDGLKVELQLHTPQSLYVKHKTHPLYEAYRVETDNKKRRQLFDRMLKVTDALIPPWGAAKVGGTSRSSQVQRLQMKAGREKLRLMGIGEKKVLGFQTAEEAGLVRTGS